MPTATIRSPAQTMHFACTVTAVRAASAEEMSHGHVHGPEGHPH